MIRNLIRDWHLRRLARIERSRERVYIKKVIHIPQRSQLDYFEAKAVEATAVSVVVLRGRPVEGLRSTPRENPSLFEELWDPYGIP